MSAETTIISTALFDEIVDALADLPYRRVVAIFHEILLKVKKNVSMRNMYLRKT